MSKPRTKNPCSQVENMYQTLCSDSKDTTHDYPNFEHVGIPLTSRIIIDGGSGNMKTNFMLHMIKQIGMFQRIYLFAKDPHQKLYKNWIEAMRKIEKKHKIDILFVSDTLANMPNPNDFQEGISSLLIVDDFVIDKNQACIAENWIKSRHKGVTMIYVAQTFFKIPIELRQQTNFIILKKLNSPADRNRILREYSCGLPDRVVIKMFIEATRNPEDAFIIACDAGMETRYRHNFDIMDVNKFITKKERMLMELDDDIDEKNDSE